MKPFAVEGPAPAAADAVERLADRLGEEGRVAVVTGDGPDAADDPGPGTTRYAVGDGRWRATGVGDVESVLDRLAPDHDYAVVHGPETTLPAVRVGDASAAGTTDADAESAARQTLVTAPTAAALDVDAVWDALADVRPHETLHSLVAAVKRSPDADRAGAVATFTGRVRTRDGPDDPPTEFLEFEAYEGVARRRMDALREDLEDRDGVWAVRLHHRRGVVEAGEDIVFVVVLAGHRQEAFRTVEDGIDRLKREVPLFKREVTVEGEFWAHQHDHDHEPDPD